MHIYFKYQNKYYSYRQYFFFRQVLLQFSVFFLQNNINPLKKPRFRLGCWVSTSFSEMNLNKSKLAYKSFTSFITKNTFFVSLSLSAGRHHQMPQLKSQYNSLKAYHNLKDILFFFRLFYFNTTTLLSYDFSPKVIVIIDDTPPSLHESWFETRYFLTQYIYHNTIKDVLYLCHFLKSYIVLFSVPKQIRLLQCKHISSRNISNTKRQQS